MLVFMCADSDGYQTVPISHSRAGFWSTWPKEVAVAGVFPKLYEETDREVVSNMWRGTEVQAQSELRRSCCKGALL